MTTDTARTYRFAPLDRSGWLLGLGGVQCTAIAAGIFASGTLLQWGAPAPVVLAPVVAGVVLALASWDGQAAHEWIALFARHGVLRLTGRAQWSATLPLLSGTAADGTKEAPLPPFLAGLSIVETGPVAWSPAGAPALVGVVSDRRDGSVTASLAVRGREFSLIERAEQERAVQLWGDALSGFCTERGVVSRVRVTEWAAPAGVAEHERFAAGHATAAEGSPAHDSYVELLAEAGPLAVRHELLVTVTVDPRRVRAGRGGGDRRTAALDTLVDELRLLSARLEAAGLVVEPPLSPQATAEAIRLRCDPGATQRLATRKASLAELAGVVSSWNAGPLATSAEWSHLRCDSALHRSYWVAEWPRLEVGPNWLEPLLLHAGGVRSVALHFEPVSPSRSRRSIERDSTRLAADEEQRTRTGFRVGARHLRAQTAVAEREVELVAGYAELEFAGFVTVTAPDEEALARAGAEYEQAAAHAGLELRPLEARQDLGLVCSLPVGRGLAARRCA
jgi:hypothetical protein